MLTADELRILDAMPAGARRIIDTLEAAGYEAYAVGGCVRDCILGRVPDDWDITTKAKPAEVKKLFKRTVDTGLKHGTVTVLIYEGDKLCSYEVTTYRIDGAYEDGRHPKEVTFSDSLKEDLKRRDFTINAMAFHPGRGITDLFGGTADIKAKLIRCVGNAEERFGEDALRMMRAVRFAAQLDSEIEAETRRAIAKLRDNLSCVSAERIRVEMEKLLISDDPAGFRLFYELGLSRIFMPEFDLCMDCEQETKHHCYSVGEHLLHSMEYIDKKKLEADVEIADKASALKILRLTMLLHDIAKPLMKTVDEAGTAHFKGHPVKSAEMAEEILRRLKYDNETINMVKLLTLHHDDRTPPEKRTVRRAMNRMGPEATPLMFYVEEADTLAQSMYMREEKLLRVRECRRIWEEIKADGECVSMKQLALSGADLIAAGVAPGRHMGELLKMMLDDVIEEPSHNDREYLMERYVK